MAKANRALFITPEFFKINSIVDINVNDKLIKDCIRTAEDMYIMPIIGSTLANALSTQIQSNSLSGSYQTLKEDYITPALLKFVMYEYLSTTFKVKNKGLVKPETAPADKEEVYISKTHILDTAEFYSEMLIGYLKDNSNLFPEYYQMTQNNDIPPANKSYSSGIIYPERIIDKGDRGKGYTYGINF